MAVLLRGMHGLGDNLHQRAVVRQMMAAGETVYLESSWVAPYHDLVASDLRIVRKPTPLRTQSKNAAREASLFHAAPSSAMRTVQVSYSPELVRSKGSVLAAMCAMTGADYATADFRMPAPQAWRARAQERIGRLPKPILVYRPLVERTEWGGCRNRNPDHDAYAALFDAIRDEFSVVSVADLVPGKEWMVGRRVKADLEFHAGELDFETIAGMISLAALVYCSPGFAVILAQAVGTPVAAVFGGYENASSFAAGARHSPTLGIEPMHPCNCFSHHHNCRKEIDVPAAAARLRAFAARHSGGSAGRS